MPEQNTPLRNKWSLTSDVPRLSDSLEKLSMVTAALARKAIKDMSEKEPPSVIVFIGGGRIQNIIADRSIDTYVVECEPQGETSGKDFSTEICGLPVSVSKRENTVAPRIVKEMIRAVRREEE